MWGDMSNMINEKTIYDAGMEIMSRAAIDIPKDYRKGLL
ncbi:MAG: hypothetical protein CFH10_02308, partial [Alphaproteobacteria bacterium MarineAlpha4_Bin2]